MIVSRNPDCGRRSYTYVITGTRRELSERSVQACAQERREGYQHGWENCKPAKTKESKQGECKWLETMVEPVGSQRSGTGIQLTRSDQAPAKSNS